MSRFEVPVKFAIGGRALGGSNRAYVELNAGDSVYFNATVPHVCRAIPEVPSRMLAIVASPDYPLHGNIAVLLDAN